MKHADFRLMGTEKDGWGDTDNERRIGKLIERYTRHVSGAKQPNLEGKTARNRAREGTLSAEYRRPRGKR